MHKPKTFNQTLNEITHNKVAKISDLNSPRSKDLPLADRVLAQYSSSGGEIRIAENCLFEGRVHRFLSTSSCSPLSKRVSQEFNQYTNKPYIYVS